MKVVILGAGKRGTLLARHLIQEKRDVVIIDNDPKRAAEVQGKMDCMVIVGSGTDPAKLREAEVEKADLEVMNIFYQVFDKGMLNDGEGREIDFKDTVIFLTSNLATELIMQACDDAELPSAEDLVAAIRPLLSRHFKPALLARMTIVPFFPLKQDALQGIARLKLAMVSQRMQATHKLELVFAPAVAEAVAARCTEAETGARNVDHVISGTLLPRISTEVLGRLGAGTLPSRLEVGYDAQAGFTFGFAEAAPAKPCQDQRR